MLSQEKNTRLHSRPMEQFKTSRDSRKQSLKFPRFQAVRKISKAKFSVYLIHCESLNQYFAMKLFPYEDGKMSSNFTREIRFTSLDHPNIVRIVSCELAREAISHGNTMMVSYLIMDYAPFGDFFDIVAKKLLSDDKLVRSYFRQLIEGLEYLHSKKVAHLDLKPENLLMGKDFRLKIADFDLAYVVGDTRILSQGTVFYRAPELLDQTCIDVEAADVYAAGIILFVLKTGGIMPHLESQLYDGMNLFNMLTENNKMFWTKHCYYQGKPSTFFDLEFRNLFNAMTKVDPRERATLADVKKLKWYNGPVYTQNELAMIIGKHF